MFAHIHVYYNSVKSTYFWHTVILFFSAKIRLIFHICKKNGGKMQNNYFVFIKLRVGEYVEYIWECEVLAQHKEKCLAHREKCRNFAAKLQLDF